MPFTVDSDDEPLLKKMGGAHEKASSWNDDDEWRPGWCSDEFERLWREGWWSSAANTDTGKWSDAAWWPDDDAWSSAASTATGGCASWKSSASVISADEDIERIADELTEQYESTLKEDAANILRESDADQRSKNMEACLRKAIQTGVIDAQSALGSQFRRKVAPEIRKHCTIEFKKEWSQLQLNELEQKKKRFKNT
jgi:hypothetical protein